jgi:hypothetical protein
VNNGMFSKQNNLSWRADEPFAILSFPRRMLIIGEFLDCAANSDSSAGIRGAHKLVLVSARGDGDSPGLEESMLKVIDEVHRIFNTNTQANKVLRQATFRTQSWVNGCVAICMDVRDTITVDRCVTYDMTQGMLIRELTQPKETEIPQRRVAPTMRSERALSPVVKESTAP